MMGAENSRPTENSASDRGLALKVSARVLVQLGEELVTDVEQAILECVKNAYDADAPGCVITVDTKATGTLIEQRAAPDLIRFSEATENVSVRFLSLNGKVLDPRKPVSSSDFIKRELTWRGSVVIEDEGDGFSIDKLKKSWLVISGSVKRPNSGQKQKTQKDRTPLGDKGVGRLGSMKIGDVLLVESAEDPDQPLASARFRWADCRTASTVDEIPVEIEARPNINRFKGTRVSVLGLNDLNHWSGSNRGLDITRRLATLVSPFEAKSKFPVRVDVDGSKSSLVAVTDALLSRAIAQFHFNWEHGADGNCYLQCAARFRDRLFRAERGKPAQQRKSEAVFTDEGKGFLAWLPTVKKLKIFQITPRPTRDWFVEFKQRIEWKDIVPMTDLPVADPGQLSGALFYFHLNNLEEADEDSEIADAPADMDEGAAAGIGIDKEMIKQMAGVSILRDGFRVRCPGDWLKIAEGMTTGSTYGLRYHNTLGYFALTGEHNHQLIEKSDREAFVDNPAFRGFMAIADKCKYFANEAIERVRRAQDDYANVVFPPNGEKVATPQNSLELVDEAVESATSAQRKTQALLSDLKEGLAHLESGTPASKSAALEKLHAAMSVAKKVQSQLERGKSASSAVKILRQEFALGKERMLALYESAAVGLSARGLAHELRTYLVEIKKRTTALEQVIKKGRSDSDATAPHIREIRLAVNNIAGAAALIDPLLPRTRAVKEKIDLHGFVEEYIKNREGSLTANEIAFINVPNKDGATIVRMNRGRLLQVLDNLVRNSVYWLRRGTKVMGIERPMKVTLKITDSGFSIADSGPGVDPDYEESIFEMFVTTKPPSEKGQGLGLFIITQLLESDGCSIELASSRNSEGRRNKFVIDLSAVLE